jgi:hypothetical protein
MKHVHHDMIVEWAKDTSREVEVYFPGIKTWSATPSPEWREDRQYRFKPAETKYIVVNGVNVPEPVRGGLEVGQRFWVTDACSGARTDLWLNSVSEYAQWLSLGIIHLTHEAAQAHIDAMLLPSRSDK